MEEIRVATAQFETRDGDKDYNLGVMEALTGQAALQGARLVVFHELSITAYTWLESLSRDEVGRVAERLDSSPSVARLRALADRTGVAVSAGLVEEDDAGRYYNCQVVVAPGRGVVASHRKIHEFVSPHLDCGSAYTVFDLFGCRFGILTCYDNNLPENARMTAMLGADVILAPHVTGCLPSPAPGRGTVDPAVWAQRERDPVRCRMEFDGPKARGWLMKWLPARAWENGVYVVYANVLGVDGGTIKPGGSMVIDPYGEVMAECRSLRDEVVVATLGPEARTLASGGSYIRARRPELYSKMIEPNTALGTDRRPEVYWQKIRKTQPWEKNS